MYTVKKLAKLSGISIRTLRFYDEIGLLKPAYYGDNKYRYYEEEQLLMLQQILFFRELGFSLANIQKIVSSSDFDKIDSLNSHRQVLENNLGQTKGLIKTIDKTISHLRGKTHMRNEELFVGFDPEKQKEYETYLVNRLGEDKVKDSIDASKNKMKNWTKEDWDKFGKEWDAICRELANLLEKGLSANSQEVQKIIQRHYRWLPWTGPTCTKEAYIGLGQGYTEFEWKKAFSPYDSNHPRLAKFMAEAMKIFAERELS
jgi:DNA-binding transcriptional MerR regulator